jgi:disulfide bond formation protein DsbB
LDIALFLALLALAAQIALGLLVVTAALAQVSNGAASALLGIRRALAGRELVLAWIVAATATAGSLYFSEVKHFPPCPLCWYQRIFMYPLVVLLAIAILRRETAISVYLLPLVAIGAGFSIYHYQLEWFPSQESGFCSTAVPCTVRWVWELGYVSLPLLALAAFISIGALLVLAYTSPSSTEEADLG